MNQKFPFANLVKKSLSITLFFAQKNNSPKGQNSEKKSKRDNFKKKLSKVLFFKKLETFIYLNK